MHKNKIPNPLTSVNIDNGNQDAVPIISDDALKPSETPSVIIR
jgi:hypothetical protein